MGGDGPGPVSGQCHGGAAPVLGWFHVGASRARARAVGAAWCLAGSGLRRLDVAALAQGLASAPPGKVSDGVGGEWHLRGTRSVLRSMGLAHEWRLS